MRILPLALPAPKLAYHVPARVDPPRVDADLSTKAITKAICEVGARVYEYAARVDTAYKCAARRSGLRHDAVHVVRAVRVDVCDCGSERRYGAHGECHLAFARSYVE